PMAVYLGQSTRIFDRASGEILYGRVPAGSVVVSGNLPSPARSCGLYCAVIVKKVDARTRAKTSLNELLRRDYTSTALLRRPTCPPCNGSSTSRTARR